MSSKGQACLPWPERMIKEVPQISKNNFCRNFNGSGRETPWCHVEDGKKEDCLLRRCSRSTFELSVTFVSHNIVCLKECRR